MKLHHSILEKIIDLPSSDPQEIRKLLDDVGLEVKDTDLTSGRAVFTIETLANRGDHLSALGVARELSARLLSPLKHPALSSSLGDRKASVPVSVHTPLCSRYGLLEMQLPQDLKLRADIAQILQPADAERHAIVHVLNYVLLELGQPMHAFDRELIEGEIRVETLAAPEEIEALDGKKYTVPAQAVVIRDRKKIVAVAGVIGCANSMVSPSTRNVLIESATFDPVSVRKTARAMKISTDASYTFERGADIESVVVGLKRVAHLAASAGGIDEGGRILGFSLNEGIATEKRKVTLSIKKLRAQMNLPRLAVTEVTARLKHLGYVVELEEANDLLKAVVPSWRLYEVRNEEDLIEDFARAHGLNGIKLELPALDPEPAEPTDEELLRMGMEPVLHGNGFIEVISKIFYSSQEVATISELDPKRKDVHVTIKNAIEESNSHVRMTTLFHHYRLIEANSRRGVLSPKIYEFARIFTLEPRQGSAAYQFEHDVLALSAAGRWHEGEWRAAENFEALLARFKGLLESVFYSVGADLSIVKSTHPFYHPGCQAALRVGRIECGIFGLAHPLIKDRLGFKVPLLHAEILLAPLKGMHREVTIAQPVDFPSIRRDITLKVPLKEFAGKIQKTLGDAKLAHLIAVALVDDFKKPEESFRRVTLRLTFQSSERTLEAGEVDQTMQQCLEYLKQQHELELAA